MNIKGLDIIKEAYTKAISVNIEEGNFHTSKYLINALEQLTGGIVAVPISPVKTKAVVPVVKNDHLSGITNNEIKQFIISYVATNGMSNASDVAYAFELTNKHKFTYHDLLVAPNGKFSPNWKRRFHSVASSLRAKNILMPHDGAYNYMYALTPEYAKIVSTTM